MALQKWSHRFLQQKVEKISTFIPKIVCLFFSKLPQHGVQAKIGELKQIKRVFTNSNCRIL
jgi:hypothetical protein